MAKEKLLNNPNYNYDGKKNSAPVFLKDGEVTTTKVISKSFDKLSDTNKELIFEGKSRFRLSSLFNWFRC